MMRNEGRTSTDCRNRQLVDDDAVTLCTSIEGTSNHSPSGQSHRCLPSYFPAPLLAFAELHVLRRRQFLFHDGEPIRMPHTIESGEIRLVHERPDGGEITLQTFTRSRTIAECSVCLDEYTCSAVATRESRIVSVLLKLFNELLARDNDFAVSWARGLARRLRNMYLRDERLRLKSTRERVLHYLNCHQHRDRSVRLEFPASTWAFELGITHENLYLTLAELEKEGVLKRDGRAVVLIAPEVRRS